MTATRGVPLLEPPRLVDQPLEDTANRALLERGPRFGGEPFDEFAFALGIVNRQAIVALEIADGEDEAYALRDEGEQATVDLVDRSPESFEFRRCHGPAS